MPFISDGEKRAKKQAGAGEKNLIVQEMRKAAPAKHHHEPISGRVLNFILMGKGDMQRQAWLMRQPKNKTAVAKQENAIPDGGHYLAKAHFSDIHTPYLLSVKY